MDTRIKSLIDYTKKKYGLHHYFLKRYSLNRNVNLLNETIYLLSMEWFPNHVMNHDDEDLNPDGTAVIEIEIQSKNTKSVIFVGGKTYANGISFQSGQIDEIVKWIENETGLVYGSQFQLYREEEGEFHFRGCIGNILTSPAGTIEVHIDEAKNLTFFSIDGEFPNKNMVREEPFTLCMERIEHIAKKQLQLMEIPVFDEQKWLPIYGVEEVYILNDDQTLIPMEGSSDPLLYSFIEGALTWDKEINIPIYRKEITVQDEVTEDQAFFGEPSPDTFPITKAEVEKCVYAVKGMLSQKYPEESGYWVLKTIHRENGYIQAILRMKKKNNHLFQRKIVVFIEPERFHIVNYIDNQELLNVFNPFKINNEQQKITKEEAYQKLKNLYELTPYYVYNFEKKQYLLCGKLDCNYGVQTKDGKVVSLQEL